MNGEVGSSSEQPTMSTVEQPTTMSTKAYERGIDDADAKENWHLWLRKQTKREVADGSNGGVFVVVKGLLGPC